MSIMRRSADRLAYRMLTQPDGRRLGVDLDEALRRQAVDREQARTRLRAEETRSRIRPHLSPIPGARWWQRGLKWSVQDDTTGMVLASGRAWSRRAAERRRYRAYLRVLAEVA